MSNVLTDEARYKAGKSQMGTFLSNQYLMWRIVSAKSIRKIILTADEFYTDILPEEITQYCYMIDVKVAFEGLKGEKTKGLKAALKFAKEQDMCMTEAQIQGANNT